jgi:hypothetical protein
MPFAKGAKVTPTYFRARSGALGAQSLSGGHMARALAALMLVFAQTTRAEYTDSCSMFALTLSSTADTYDSKLRSFKSACDAYIGYSKDDESACGEYGYLRSSAKRAQRELGDAQNNVALYCGVGDDLFRAARQSANSEVTALRKEKAALEKQIKALEAEVTRLKELK